VIEGDFESGLPERTICLISKQEFVMQVKKLLPSLAAVVLLGTSPAWSADSAIGRITYIYPDGHRIILDSHDEYTLAPNIDASKLGVAEFVRLVLAGGQVTQVSPGPLSMAALD
jgi:hypothetical protein